MYYVAAFCWQNVWNYSRFIVCRAATNHSKEALIISWMRSLTESHSCLNCILRSERSCNQPYDHRNLSYINLPMFQLITLMPAEETLVNLKIPSETLLFKRFILLCASSYEKNSTIHFTKSFWGSNTAQRPVTCKHYRV